MNDKLGLFYSFFSFSHFSFILFWLLFSFFFILNLDKGYDVILCMIVI